MALPTRGTRLRRSSNRHRPRTASAAVSTDIGWSFPGITPHLPSFEFPFPPGRFNGRSTGRPGRLPRRLKAVAESLRRHTTRLSCRSESWPRRSATARSKRTTPPRPRRLREVPSRVDEAAGERRWPEAPFWRRRHQPGFGGDVVNRQRKSTASPCAQAKGSTISTFALAKSRRLRVTTASPYVRAVAAIKLSLIGIERPLARRSARRRAQRRPVAASHGRQ
jgi:hypothetical protein